jgi:hypothetical protein
MIKIIKNKTPNDIFISDVGQLFPMDSSSTLNPTQYPYFESSQDIIPYILDGSLVISDNNYDLNPRIGLALIQDNQQTLTEYYTLVQDDDVLTGNGKVLQLDDENWEIEEDFEEDDYPTWR